MQAKLHAPERRRRWGTEFSRKWFSLRGVVYPEGHPKAGKSISGNAKLSDYQTAMCEHMIARGWPVEAEIDKANDGFYLGKKNYARDLVAKIEWMPPEVDDWLDRRKVGDGRTLRDLFNEDTKKLRAVRVEVQALINSDAPQQTGPRTGEHRLGG